MLISVMLSKNLVFSQKDNCILVFPHEKVVGCLRIKGMEHVICDVMVCHINILAAAILLLVSTLMLQFSSTLHLFKR